MKYNFIKTLVRIIHSLSLRWTSKHCTNPRNKKIFHRMWNGDWHFIWCGHSVHKSTILNRRSSWVSCIFGSSFIMWSMVNTKLLAVQILLVKQNFKEFGPLHSCHFLWIKFILLKMYDEFEKEFKINVHILLLLLFILSKILVKVHVFRNTWTKVSSVICNLTTIFVASFA